MRQAWRRRAGLWLGVALWCSGAIAAPPQAGAVAADPADASAARGPAVVRIIRQGGNYRMTVDGQPFTIKGAGLGDIDQEGLAARGGNSFRTWSTGDDVAKVRAMLDRAQRNGLKVAMGLDVARERHGFDYDDAQAVAAQQQRIEAEVALYKDHPAVLMWLVGNELNLEHRNPRVWNAVNDITLAIHRIDPNHPVMTPLAGFNAGLIAEIKARAPALDLLGVQLYGDINVLPGKLREAGWTGAYVVTEWGPTGHWESPLTTWGAAIEDDASRKAARLLERYQQYIASDTRQTLGSYVFLWGQKQERTPTWYGLFLKSGESTPGVDAMQFLWTGQWPANRAPAIEPILMDGLPATQSVSLAPGSEHEAHVRASDPDQDPLRFQWYVLKETTATSTGGDHEDVPASVRVRMTFQGQGGLKFQAPAQPGAYRLFVEVRDGQGHAAYANFPFEVRAGEAQRQALAAGNAAWALAVERGDVDALLQRYADDATLMPEHAPLRRGRDGIADYLRPWTAQSGVTRWQRSTESIDEAGEHFIEIGRYAQRLQRSGQPAFDYTGKYLAVWRKSPQGARVIAELWGAEAPFDRAQLPELAPAAPTPPALDSSVEDVRRALAERNALISTLVKQRRGEEHAALFTDDAAYLTYYTPTLRGIAPIRAYFVEHERPGPVSIDDIAILSDGVRPLSGALQLEEGRYRVGWRAGGDSGVVVGKSLNIWRRGADGQWRMFRQAVNHD